MKSSSQGIFSAQTVIRQSYRDHQFVSTENYDEKKTFNNLRVRWLRRFPVFWTAPAMVVHPRRCFSQCLFDGLVVVSSHISIMTSTASTASAAAPEPAPAASSSSSAAAAAAAAAGEAKMEAKKGVRQSNRLAFHIFITAATLASEKTTTTTTTTTTTSSGWCAPVWIHIRKKFQNRFCPRRFFSSTLINVMQRHFAGRLFLSDDNSLWEIISPAFYLVL